MGKINKMFMQNADSIPFDKGSYRSAKTPIYIFAAMVYYKKRKLSNIPPAWAASDGAAPFLIFALSLAISVGCLYTESSRNVKGGCI